MIKKYDIDEYSCKNLKVGDKVLVEVEIIDIDKKATDQKYQVQELHWLKNSQIIGRVSELSIEEKAEKIGKAILDKVIRFK
jgi:hypothetical protein